MVNIKDFILQSGSVVALVLSLILLSSFLILATVTEDFAKIKKEIGGEISSIVKKQLGQSSEFNFSVEEMKKACDNPGMMGKGATDSYNLDFICKEFADGRINSKEELLTVFSDSVAKQGVEGLTLGVTAELIKLKVLGFYALIAGVVGLILSFGLAYLVTMKLAKGIETFGYYSLIFGFVGLILWVLVYFLAPGVVKILSDLIFKQLNDQSISDLGIIEIVEKVLSSAISTIREVLLRPVYLHLVMALVGLIAWKTRFGLKTD
ncbi:hypothetical protein HZC08_00420 [Candidatus Micrarchaeota archaeon]|nr:hypothetical protein [Candidatus Micrarchaeota archaeon]